MRKNLTRHSWVAAALVGLLAPVASLNAQEGGASGAAPSKNIPAPSSPVSGNATAGKGLYYSFGCYACHGYNGETGARPFVGRWGHLATEQEFLTFLRGRANVAPLVPSTSMPNFGEASVSDKQAKDIYAYIRSFKSSAPELKDAPALTAILDAAKQEKK